MQLLAASIDSSIAGADWPQWLIRRRELLTLLRSEAGFLPGVAEQLILATPARIELYIWTSEPEAAGAAVHELFEREQFPPTLRVLRDSEAVRHIFALVAGEDLLEGEEVAGILAAFRPRRDSSPGPEAATAVPLLAEALHRLHRALLARGTPTPEELCPNGAVEELAASVFEDLHRKQLLIIGGDPRAIAVAQRLLGLGPRRVTLMIPPPEGLREACLHLGTWEVLDAPSEEHVLRADLIVLGCLYTQETETRRAMEAALSRPAGKLRLLLNISDVSIRASLSRTDPDLLLFEGPELAGFHRERQRRWANELEEIHASVRREQEEFLAWVNQVRLEWFLTVLRQRGEAVRQRYLERYGRNLGTPEREAITELIDNLVRTVLEEVTANFSGEKGAPPLGLKEYELLCRLFDVPMELNPPGREEGED